MLKLNLLIIFLLLCDQNALDGEGKTLNFKEKNEISDIVLDYLTSENELDSIDICNTKLFFSNEVVNLHSLFSDELLETKKISKKYTKVELISTLEKFKKQNDSLNIVWPWTPHGNREYLNSFYFSKGFYGYYTVVQHLADYKKNYREIDNIQFKRTFLFKKRNYRRIKLVSIKLGISE